MHGESLVCIHTRYLGTILGFSSSRNVPSMKPRPFYQDTLKIISLTLSFVLLSLHCTCDFLRMFAFKMLYKGQSAAKRIGKCVLYQTYV